MTDIHIAFKSPYTSPAPSGGEQQILGKFPSRERTTNVLPGWPHLLTFSALTTTTYPCPCSSNQKTCYYPTLHYCKPSAPSLAVPLHTFDLGTPADPFRPWPGKTSLEKMPLPSIHPLCTPRLGQEHFLHTSMETWYSTPVLDPAVPRNTVRVLPSTGMQ